MARNKNKKKNIVSNSSDDYNLKKSLSKLHKSSNRYQNTQRDITSEKLDINNKTRQDDINSSSLGIENLRETKSLYDIKLSVSERYEKLNDKNEHSIKELETKLEGRLGKKIDEKLFYGAVAALVIIGGIIYTLSYNDLINDTEENSKYIEQNKVTSKNLIEKTNHLEKKQVDNKNRILKLELGKEKHLDANKKK